MERLHIPLGNTQATRRSRRVVSQILLVLTGLLFVLIGSTLWFTRNTTARSLPEGTILAIRFLPTARTWPILEKYLRSIPLIRGRALTISDLKPWTEGELTWFFLEDGGRGVLLRTDPKKLPRDLLDSQGVLVQDISSHVVLLSDRVVPLNLSRLPRLSPWQIFLPWSTPLGLVYTSSPPERWSTGILSANRSGLSLHLPRIPMKSQPVESIPESVFASVTIPADTEAPRPILAVIDRFLRSSAPTLTDLFTMKRLTPTMVWLADAKEGMGYLIVWQKNGITDDEATSLLKAGAALQAPATRSFLLEDRTIARELIADPSEMTVEFKTISSSPVYRTKTTKNEQILMANLSDQLVVSNQDDLIEFWLKKDKNKKNTPICFYPLLYIDLPKLLSTSSTGQTAYQDSILQLISLNLSKISVKNSFLSSKITLCE